MRGTLIVITAPSGAGKTSIINRLIREIPNLAYSVSHTTRERREDEVEGRDYFFYITQDEFMERVRQEEFLEWAYVHGNLYGTSRKFIEENLERGRDCLLDIDVQGGKRVREIFPDGIYIFILPPSFEDLEKRLRKRSTERDEEIQLRLRNARREAEEGTGIYDYTVVNDSLDRAVGEIAGIIRRKKEEMRRR